MERAWSGGWWAQGAAPEKAHLKADVNVCRKGEQGFEEEMRSGAERARQVQIGGADIAGWRLCRSASLSAALFLSLRAQWYWCSSMSSTAKCPSVTRPTPSAAHQRTPMGENKKTNMWYRHKYPHQWCMYACMPCLCVLIVDWLLCRRHRPLMLSVLQAIRCRVLLQLLLLYSLPKYSSRKERQTEESPNVC